MSSDSGRRPEHLRLASAQRRLNAFLAELSRLQTLSFPHRDGRDALDAIRAQFNEYLEPVPENASRDTINSLCLEIGFLVEQYTAVLGFILRSTNVRNPFEVHYPLKRMVNALLETDSRLLMSSEWDFVPFTYPMSLEFLPNYVLVGAPAPESGNTLITPLAGHEIGHSVWQQSTLAADIEDRLAEKVDIEVRALSAAKKDLFSELKLGDLGFDLLKEDCVQSAILQAEEIFCDILGLRLFEHAYLYAFEYFLAPGEEAVALEYPSNKRRMEILQQVAQRLDITLTLGDPFDNWLDAKSTSPREVVMADVIHSACNDIIPHIEKEALDIVDKGEIPRSRMEVVAEITRAFEHSEPYHDRATLGEIVTAGWFCVLDRGGMARNAEGITVLNDIMLKSVEVSEYLGKTRC